MVGVATDAAGLLSVWANWWFLGGRVIEPSAIVPQTGNGHVPEYVGCECLWMKQFLFH